MRQEQSDNQLWEQPKLILLVRGNPEECVLTACKEPVACQDGESGDYDFDLVAS